MTQGLICDKLALINIEQEHKDVEQILFGICVGMHKENNNMEIKLIAVKALHNALKFIKSLFQMKEISDFIMDLQIFCCMAKNPDVELAAYQCLMDIAMFFYDFMNVEYINAILTNLTLPAMKSDDVSIVVAAVEFWNVIAEEEKERSGIFLGLKVVRL